MRTLSEKLESIKIAKDLSFRKFGEMVGIAHSTIYQIIREGKTSLKPHVKEKLIELFTEINEDDFTDIIESNVSRPNEIGDTIARLLEQYDSSKLTKIRELRTNY